MRLGRRQEMKEQVEDSVPGLSCSLTAFENNCSVT